jgi:hypothetical protein
LLNEVYSFEFGCWMIEAGRSMAIEMIVAVGGREFNGLDVEVAGDDTS